MVYNQHASEIFYIAKKAGDIIMEFYTGKIDVIMKDDESPVTPADLAANKYIVEQLTRLTPEIPVVSEENTEEQNKKAAKGKTFWIVDPLDGTKSYISKTGEFTVNIALITDGVLEGGTIYLPATKVGYFTAEDGNAYKQEGDNLPSEIRVRPVPSEGLTVIASTSHRTPETDEYINKLGSVNELLSAASSMKLCLIADGKADIYPRFGPTMEWDIAAGHAILNAAGGMLENIDGSEFKYCKDGFLNPYFIAKGQA